MACTFFEACSLGGHWRVELDGSPGHWMSEAAGGADCNPSIDGHPWSERPGLASVPRAFSPAIFRWRAQGWDDIASKSSSNSSRISRFFQTAVPTSRQGACRLRLRRSFSQSIGVATSLSFSVKA